LWKTYRRSNPNVIVVELFPFGRRKFRGELLPILEDARSLPAQRRPIVSCSVRDILVGRKDAQAHHDRNAADLLQRYFDAVLVHSDPAFAQLEESFSADVQIPVPLYYTGFVHDNPTPTRRVGGPAGSLIVSAGGGIVGEPLLRAVVEAHSLPAAAGAPPLTVIAGPFLPEPAWQRLQALVSNRRRVKLLRSVTNLSADLAAASGSISQCGYNTAMDLVASGVPALVVPYYTRTEDEQLRRSRRLESLGALRVVVPEEATPERLATEMAALPSFRPAAAALDLKGAERSARMLANLWYSGAPAHKALPSTAQPAWMGA
jgi:predicted glycosyltransferase